MTGAFKEYRTKTPDSGPHGLAADKDGNIWFAAIFQGYIGKLDPKTGTITECWREQSNRRGLLRLTRSLWAFGEPQKSIRLIAICFSLQYRLPMPALVLAQTIRLIGVRPSCVAAAWTVGRPRQSINVPNRPPSAR
jgi:hypothetical protein